MIKNKIFRHKKTGKFEIQINLMKINNYDEYEPKSEEEYDKIIFEIQNRENWKMRSNKSFCSRPGMFSIKLPNGLIFFTQFRDSMLRDIDTPNLFELLSIQDHLDSDLVEIAVIDSKTNKFVTKKILPNITLGDDVVENLNMSEWLDVFDIVRNYEM